MLIFVSDFTHFKVIEYSAIFKREIACQDKNYVLRIEKLIDKLL